MHFREVIRTLGLSVGAVALLATLGCQRGTEQSKEATPSVSSPAPAPTAPQVMPDKEAIAAAVANADRMAGDSDEDAWRKPQAVLEFLGVQNGMRVLDYFAASGYYSELLSRAIGPSGHVIVYNNPGYAEFAGEKLTQRFAKQRLANAQVLTVPTDALQLPDASLDAVLFVLSYHDLYGQPKEAKAPMGDPAAVTVGLFKALAPGGVVVVVDHAAKAGGDTKAVVDALHRIDPEAVKRDFAAAGFVYEAESDALRHSEDDRSKPVFDESVRHKTDQFIYRFRKPAHP